MSNTKDYDFRKFYKDRLEKRLVEYLEVASGLYSSETGETIQAQVALVSKSIENIALMMAEQGYINNQGRFVRFQPSDLLTIQQALNMALKMRADVMMMPMGLEALTKTMSALDKTSSAHSSSTNPHTGLSEPPPMVAVDSRDPPTMEEEIGAVKDAEEVLQPVNLPSKI